MNRKGAKAILRDEIFKQEVLSDRHFERCFPPCAQSDSTATFKCFDMAKSLAVYKDGRRRQLFPNNTTVAQNLAILFQKGVCAE